MELVVALGNYHLIQIIIAAQYLWFYGVDKQTPLQLSLSKNSREQMTFMCLNPLPMASLLKGLCFIGTFLCV